MSDPIYQQMSIFDDVLPRYTINKKVRLIEFFAGIGAQAKALEVLGVPFEHYKICEWAYNSYCAYNSIHIKDNKDYSLNLTKEQLIEKVKGTSINYNEPLNDKALAKKSIEWLKNAYNNIIATHNLVNIMNVKGKDLEIVDKDNYQYILTYSFPCQDLSLAGLRKGMSVSQADGGTRSGLLWEVERILTELHRERESMPDILIMENVPEVCGSKNVRDFEKWQAKLQELGYTNYCEILNAKNYGIPQNRRRCFMVSILGNYNYVFPKKIPLKLRLKDFLENNVDEKYFLSKKMLDGMINTKFHQYQLENRLQDTNNCIDTLTTATGARCPHCIPIKNANSKGYEEATDGDGIDISSRMESHRGTVQKDSCQTLTCQGGNNVGVVVSNLKERLCNELVENGKVKEGDIVKHSFTNQILSGKKKAVEKQDGMITLTTRGDCFGVAVKDYKNYVSWKDKKGRINTQDHRACKENCLSTTIPAMERAIPNVANTNLRIRKLTPCECLWLMGFERKDYQALSDINLSDSAIYHVAGDSIVVSVLVAIFSNLINELDTHEEIISKYVGGIKNENRKY